MGTEPLVLAIDDDPGILKLIKLELADQGLHLLTADRGEEALRIAFERRPDLVVLDIVLPDMSGLEVMRRLRERVPVPIILVTAKDADQDKIRGLELGADDYIAKPFNPEELSARVRAVLRRARHETDSPPVIRANDLEIDLERRLVTLKGEVVSLTRTEWNLLQKLAENAGKVMENAEILTKVWGPEYRDDLQYLRVWVSRLRSKLDPERQTPDLIRTFSGIGYMLDPTASVKEAEASKKQTSPAFAGLFCCRTREAAHGGPGD
jgi:two-component system KDP operon response regulator KdpE